MSKPKTIADLKINWNFNFETYLAYDNFRKDFQKKNKNLKNYVIVSNSYFFNIVVDNVKRQFLLRTMDVTFNKYCSLFELMFQIDFEVSMNLFMKQSDFSYKLVKFVRISEIEYDIILRKVGKKK